MSTLLEDIIRTYLIEGRTVAKIRNVSAAETAVARRAGAVHSYAVLVKGTKNSEDIINLVQAATLASTGADTENKVAVGQTSKFANGDYCYVMSDPLPKKRQIIVVRIFKTTDITKNHLNIKNATSSYETAGNIGASDFFTVTLFKQLLIGEKQDTTPVDDLKSNESEASDIINTATDVLAGNKQVTDHDLSRDGKVVGKFTGTMDKNDVPIQGKAVLTDGQWFDGTFKDGAFVSGTCKKILDNGDIFEGELMDGVPTANVMHHITATKSGAYYEGTVDTDFKQVDGTVYKSSAKTEKIGDFKSGEWIEVAKPVSIKYTYKVTTDNAEFLKVQQQMITWLEANGISTAPVTSAPYKTYKTLKDAIAGKTVGSYGDVTKSTVALIKGILVKQLGKTIDSDATYVDEKFIDLIK